jgi:hypothetical protein
LEVAGVTSKKKQQKHSLRQELFSDNVWMHELYAFIVDHIGTATQRTQSVQTVFSKFVVEISSVAHGSN